MKNKYLIKKLLGTALALVLGISVLSGCADASEADAQVTTDTQATVVKEEAENTDSADNTAQQEESESSEPVKLRVGNFSITWSEGFDIAYAKGIYDEIFKDDNVEIEVVQLAHGPAALEAFLAGEIDIVDGIGDQPILSGIVGKDVNVQILGVAATVPDQGIITANDSDIKSIEDLKGKAISVPIGSGGHKIFLQILEDVGIAPEDVEIVNLTDNSSVLAALDKGEIDAAYLSGGTFDKIKAEGSYNIIKDAADYPSYLYYVVDGVFLEEHPDIVKKYLEGAVEGAKYIDANPDESFEIIAELSDLDTESVKSTLTAIDYHPLFDEKARENLYSTGDFLYDQELISTPIEKEQIDSHVSDIIFEVLK